MHIQTESDDLTWLGNHPVLGLPFLVLALPLYIVTGALLGIWELLALSWAPDVILGWQLLWRKE